jgi:hypothetical protein
VSQGSRPARGTRHSLFGDEPLEPLSRRLLQVAGVLSLLLILVAVNSLFNDGGSESPFNPNPVAAAAQRTEEVPGMRMNMTMKFTSESSPPATMTGKGTYNGESNLAEIVYHGAINGQQMEFDAVLGEDAWYFRYPQFAGRMPEGKEWIKLEGFPGQKDASTPGVGSPDESLRMLSTAGAVRRLGQVKIGHVQTTRYRVTMTPAGLVEGLHAQDKDELAEQIEQIEPRIVGSVHAEAFIAPDGMLRRMRTLATESINGKPITTEIRADLFDFGIHPEIQIPDDSEVLELGPEVEESLERLGQAS